MREVTGFPWPTLLFTYAGLWLAAYAVMRAFDAPVRTWDDNDTETNDE
jgi:hypothetical protein